MSVASILESMLDARHSMKRRWPFFAANRYQAGAPAARRPLTIVSGASSAALAGEVFVDGARASAQWPTTNARGLEMPNRPITRASHAAHAACEAIVTMNLPGSGRPAAES